MSMTTPEPPGYCDPPPPRTQGAGWRPDPRVSPWAMLSHAFSVQNPRCRLKACDNIVGRASPPAGHPLLPGEVELRLLPPGRLERLCVGRRGHALGRLEPVQEALELRRP